MRTLLGDRIHVGNRFLAAIGGPEIDERAWRQHGLHGLTTRIAARDEENETSWIDMDLSFAPGLYHIVEARIDGVDVTPFASPEWSQA